VRILGLIEVFEKISRDDTGRVQYHFVVLDYLCAALGGEARAGSDASDVAWVTESELSQYSLTPGSLPVIQKAFQRVGEPGSH
jgi:8-oxo-dGTP diphosphatase